MIYRKIKSTIVCNYEKIKSYQWFHGMYDEKTR